MSLTPPVPQRDSDWEIRVAVLLSLLLQTLLIFIGPMRKRTSHPFPRFVVWSCYLLADWVADLALGLLLNNMGNIGGNSSSSSSVSRTSSKRGGGGAIGATSSGSPIIFAFWTPFLLLHLGGPDTITAYSLEDNELWLRHLIGLLFELFSALVIFGCSFHTNPMVPATFLMFFVGIVKYSERTYSLYSGSVDGFRANILEPPDPGPNYAKLMTEFDGKKNAGLVVRIAIADGPASKAQEAADQEETDHLVVRSTKSVEARAYDFYLIFRRLFVNLILSFKERRLSQAFFLKPENTSEAFEVIEVELNFIYDMVYTKAPVAHSRFGWVLRFLCSGCLVASLVIFFFLHKASHGISRADVGITYALLLGGLALDAAALLMLLFSNRITVHLENSQRFRWLAELTKKVAKKWRMRMPRWSQKTSQLNLINHCLGKPDRYPTIDWSSVDWWRRLLNKAAKTLRIEEIVDDFVFIKRKRIPPPSCKGSVLDLIFEGLKKEAELQNEVNKQKKENASKQKAIEEEKASKQKAIEEEEETNKLKNIKEEGDNKQKGIKEEEASKKEEEAKNICDCRGERVIKKNKYDIIKAFDEMKNRTINNPMKNPTINDPMKNPTINDPMKNIINGLTKNLVDNSNEKFQLILKSVTVSEFDESLLLWHIATDLCCFKEEEKEEEKEVVSCTLSEYMLYLLIKQPEMLSATGGIGLLRYRDTCAEARQFFGSMVEWGPNQKDAQKMLLSVNTSEKPAAVKGDRSKSVLFDAVILAKVLRSLGDDKLMWRVIAGVWQEMLTFAAGKCRGSTHVRQLSRGGELITIVWFLMAHMGLGDMYQIQEGDAKAKLIVFDQ